MFSMVQGVGASATSLPPTDTTKTSLDWILSRKNKSCARSWRVRSFRVVASTAVLMAAHFCFASDAVELLLSAVSK